MNAVAARLIKKITPLTVVGGPVNPDMPQPLKEPRDLYDLFGVAVKTRSGKTDRGEWLQFIGNFEAVTPEGEIISAPRCHIPQPFEDMLYAQLAQVQASDPKATVQFAVRVSIVPPTKGKPSAVGYEYRVTPLVNAETNSPLSLLREAAAKNHKLLGHDGGAATRVVGGSGGRGR